MTEPVEVSKCEDCPFLHGSDFTQFEDCHYGEGRSFNYDLYEHTHEMFPAGKMTDFPEWCPLAEVIIRRL